MSKLKILADGKSGEAFARQKRGKLFELLMANVLKHYGYLVEQKPNVNYAGMEIDIEGRHAISGTPLYAECKCYESEVDSSKLQAFYGKYTNFWFDDMNCQGIFIALPGINSHAKGFYRTISSKNRNQSFRILEESDVLEAILASSVVVRPELIAEQITPEMVSPGDWVLLYTEKGYFWIQYILPPGGVIPNRYAIFTARGVIVSDRASADEFIQLWPELADFELLMPKETSIVLIPSSQQDSEEVVEVRGSSACFEYQFPASPEHFVGRHEVHSEIQSFVDAILNKKTSSRGILFEANSGWGKSSTVLSTVSRLRSMGHFAVAIDSRSASSSQFILRVIEYVVTKFGDFDGILSNPQKYAAISGFEGAIRTVTSLGQSLQSCDKILFIFLDQFENLFFLQDALKRIRDIFLKLEDAQTNVVLGFSWKTDLIGFTNEFPYIIRDTLTSGSKRIALGAFSDVETNALLKKLSEELRADLRKDLAFLLSEFSQGYPWLLKKLCAHVKSLRESGVPQLDIANNLLNIEELFEEDLSGLSSEQEDTLRRIARTAPISILEGDDFKPSVVQSLVNARLVVRVGSKYDIYWDNFRDYLNFGRIPVQDNYILHTGVSTVMQNMKLIADNGGEMDKLEFQRKAGLSSNTLYNVLRDMKLLGLARVENSKIKQLANFPNDSDETQELFRSHLKDRLRRNRLVSRILEALEANGELDVTGIAALLAKATPYISATPKTWIVYARLFASWIDAADLAIFDSVSNVLEPMTLVRERNLRMVSRRSKMLVPRIQYSPIERAILRIGDSFSKGGRIDWTGFKKSTLAKAIANMEDLGFITINRRMKFIVATDRLFGFIANPENRREIFGESSLQIKSFAAFVKILNENPLRKLTNIQMAQELAKELGVSWKTGTSETSVKIMLDWARHTGLAPEIYWDTRSSKNIKRQHRTSNTAIQIPLFYFEDA